MPNDDRRHGRNTWKGQNMTDYPTNEMAMMGTPHENQPYNVILMLPDDMRGDEACAADWIRRVLVYGEPTDAGIDAMIEEAREVAAEVLGWTENYEPDDPALAERKNTLEPVAIYAGHIFDIYQP